MSDNPKDDDWGMTMPPKRLDELKSRESVENFAPKTDAAPSQPADDDWGITTPNVKIPQDAVPPSQAPSQPFAEYDKTAPNINIPQQFSEAPKTPPNPPPDDWGMTEANVNIPKESKKDEWQMPQPVFRVSEGETPNFDKTTPNFNLKDLPGDFGSAYDEEPNNKTAPYYQLPENQVESNFAAESQPVIAAQSPETPKEKPAAKAPSGNGKWILMLGGLFGFFLIVTACLVAAYFLYFDTSNTVKSVDQNANKTVDPNTNKTVDSKPTPAVPTTNALPATVNYKGEMVLVKAGEFTMGSDAGGDESKPAHKVTVPAFYIDKTEVTNAQYKAFCDETKHSYPTSQSWNKNYFVENPNAPVVGVSFDDAKEFAVWAGKRLPTEEEWEKAASWNPATQTKFDFPWGNEFENGKTAFDLYAPKDVGSFPLGASPSGAVDMAGNVAEWVDAFFKPYPGNTISNPEFGETNRVVRGGHIGSKNNDSLKTTKRIYVLPGYVPDDKNPSLIGFRCAIPADDSRLQSVVEKQ